MHLADLAKESHDTAISKGWWDDRDRNFGELMTLAISELIEAFEEYRDGHDLDEIYFVEDKDGNMKPEGVPVELADLYIRLGDTTERYQIDIEKALELKLAYNKTRGYRHGNKRA